MPTMVQNKNLQIQPRILLSPIVIFLTLSSISTRPGSKYSKQVSSCLLSMRILLFWKAYIDVAVSRKRMKGGPCIKISILGQMVMANLREYKRVVQNTSIKTTYNQSLYYSHP
jgi:hypothetical protein